MENSNESKTKKSPESDVIIDYPPYINSYGKIPGFFDKIKKAQVPTKFSANFLKTIIGFKSSSDYAFISFLKRLKFLDGANIPTDRYKEYRNDSKSEFIMADAIKEAYTNLYQTNEFVHDLERKDLLALIKQRTGAGEKDKIIPTVLNTFLKLKSIANFGKQPFKKEETAPTVQKSIENLTVLSKPNVPLGISYTITLNLPATTNIEVFNAIFKSLREHILNEK